MKTVFNMTLQVCRICLASNVKLLSFETPPLSQCIEYIPVLKENKEGLPQHACYECDAVLRKCFKLIHKSLKSQDVLRNLIHTVGKSKQKELLKSQRNDLKLHSSLSITHIDPESLISVTHDDEKPIKTETPESDDEYLCRDEQNTEEDGDDDVNDKNVDLVVEELQVTKEDEVLSDDEALSKLQKKQLKNGKKKSRSVAKCKKKKVEEVVTKKERNTRSKAKQLENQIKQCFDIIKLTLEEQIAELQSRKQSSAYTSAKLRCEICYKTYQKQTAFDNHMTEHKPEHGPFECPVCKKRFKIEDIYWRHIVANHEKQYRCKLCPYVCKERQAHIHMGSHEGMTYMFKCKHCDFVTDNQKSYTSHRRAAHARRLACGRCGRGFISERGLNLHRSRGHRTDVAEEDESSAAYPCKDCDVKFLTEDALAVHLRTSHRLDGENDGDGKREVCKICSEVFSSKEELTNHNEERHSLKSMYPRKCDYCECVVSSSRAHWLHVRGAHPALRPHYRSLRRQLYLCELCGRGFKSQIELRHHGLRHAGPPRLPCALAACPAHFYDEYQRRQHLKHVHCDERPHRCHVCQLAFKLRGNLNRHMVVHTGAKPYSCGVCGAQFTQSGSRDLHHRTVHRRLPHPPRQRKRAACNGTTHETPTV